MTVYSMRLHYPVPGSPREQQRPLVLCCFSVLASERASSSSSSSSASRSSLGGSLSSYSSSSSSSLNQAQPCLTHPGRAYRKDLVAQRARQPMQLISCEGPLTGTAVIFPISSLRTCWMLPINKMRCVTHLRSPVRAVGPQTSALAIKRRVLIHAVVHADIWQTLNTWPRLH